ncbi:hypothetical protein AWB78_06013 [Caballeronia calidae]|uniref:Uncharacterized protein n=2 Tax=Caballeronia calidae TaxID=1777139 RepID=A0A158E1U5_9BURK|nr:hypothetical protein AWB78_06013 [Caballeronia calidae]
MVTLMDALPRSFRARDFSVRALRARRFHAAAIAGLICAATHAQTQCPGYVETDAGSAFDIASIIRDTGSPESALDKIRNAVARVNAGGGCAIFRDRLACEETLTLANKAIAALQACASPTVPKNTKRG